MSKMPERPSIAREYTGTRAEWEWDTYYEDMIRWQAEQIKSLRTENEQLRRRFAGLPEIGP